MLDESLKNSLAKSAHHPELSKIMDYAVFPAGKLFRPKLVEAMALDLDQSMSANHKHLANALELHHAYTLVHDDLPAMDNDLIRRGKPSTHAAFGEWKAILTGDALLIYSFEELMKIDHPELKNIHRLFSWGTGAKGLILGQFLDLGAQGNLGLADIIRIHELKTARLIQIATVGSYLLSSQKKSLRSFIEYLKLGREIGVSFQLLDDLNELTDSTVSDHEKEINPFLMDPCEASNSCKSSIIKIRDIINRKNLTHLREMMRTYFLKNHQDFRKYEEALLKNISKDFDPSWIELLKSL